MSIDKSMIGRFKTIVEATLYSIGIFINNISDNGFKMAISDAILIRSYNDPFQPLLEKYEIEKKFLFKTQVSPESSYFYYILDGSGDGATCSNEKWIEKSFSDAPSALKSSISDVNHSIACEVSGYLKKLKNKNLLGFLWD